MPNAADGPQCRSTEYAEVSDTSAVGVPAQAVVACFNVLLASECLTRDLVGQRRSQKAETVIMRPVQGFS